jgi:adenylylsulfate kinase
MAFETRASRKRSVVKALTYRGVIVCLDFVVIYLLTGQAVKAAAFMIVSNVYTTAAYFLHERLWARVRWGLEKRAS